MASFVIGELNWVDYLALIGALLVLVWLGIYVATSAAFHGAMFCERACGVSFRAVLRHLEQVTKGKQPTLAEHRDMLLEELSSIKRDAPEWAEDVLRLCQEIVVTSIDDHDEYWSGCQLMICATVADAVRGMLATSSAHQVPGIIAELQGIALMLRLNTSAQVRRDVGIAVAAQGNV